LGKGESEQQKDGVIELPYTKNNNFSFLNNDKKAFGTQFPQMNREIKFRAWRRQGFRSKKFKPCTNAQ
jgi:hypothetical protein